MNRSAPAPLSGLGTRRTVFVIFLLLAAAMPVTAIGGCSRRVAQPPPPPPPEAGLRPGDKVKGSIVPEAEWPGPVRDWVGALEQSVRPLATSVVVGDDVYFVVMPATAAVFRSLEWVFGSDWDVVVDPVGPDAPATPLVVRIPGLAEFWDWFNCKCPQTWVPMVVDRLGVGPGVIPADGTVAVVSPGKGAAVGVPVHVTGYAKMPAAEIGFRVRDPCGKLLLESWSSTSSGEPNWGSFAVDLDFATPTGGEVVVEFCFMKHVGGYAGPSGPVPEVIKVGELRLRVGP